LIPGTTQFDPKPFKGIAVILHADASVTKEPIDKTRRVMIGGKDIFDPSQPFWAGKVPDLKWQE
jgi:hypothetical protein